MGQGILILEDIPNEEVRSRVREFLKRHALNISSEQIENLIKSPPLILSRRMPEDLGRRWVYFLEVLGAKARFVPNEGELFKTGGLVSHLKTASKSLLLNSRENLSLLLPIKKVIWVLSRLKPSLRSSKGYIPKKRGLLPVRKTPWTLTTSMISPLLKPF